MSSSEKSGRSGLILAMVIFGTVGIFRRWIPLSSSIIAFVRGVIGTVFLVCWLAVKKQKIDRISIKKYFPLLLLSGSAIGFNWIFLFEAYCYTSVATATLCYYLAPILVILAAPVVVKEALTPRKAICTAAALLGMVLVSGVLSAGFCGMEEMKGILFGLAAAVLYASVILMNKKMPGIPAMDKTVFQLGFASAALFPYILLTEDLSRIRVTPLAVLPLVLMGIVHTGIAYLLYFGSMGQLKAHTVALFSYIDPVLAILLSALLLHEPMGITEAIGAVLILGAAYISETGK